MPVNVAAGHTFDKLAPAGVRPLPGGGTFVARRLTARLIFSDRRCQRRRQLPAFFVREDMPVKPDAPTKRQRVVVPSSAAATVDSSIFRVSASSRLVCPARPIKFTSPNRGVVIIVRDAPTFSERQPRSKSSRRTQELWGRIKILRGNTHSPDARVMLGLRRSPGGCRPSSIASERAAVARKRARTETSHNLDLDPVKLWFTAPPPGRNTTTTSAASTPGRRIIARLQVGARAWQVSEANTLDLDLNFGEYYFNGTRPSRFTVTGDENLASFFDIYAGDFDRFASVFPLSRPQRRSVGQRHC